MPGCVYVAPMCKKQKWAAEEGWSQKGPKSWPDKRKHTVQIHTPSLALSPGKETQRVNKLLK